MPLKLKHNCLSPVVWVQSLNALLLILETALPSGNISNSPFWLQLATVLEDFLFNERWELCALCLLVVLVRYFCMCTIGG